MHGLLKFLFPGEAKMCPCIFERLSRTTKTKKCPTSYDPFSGYV